MRELCIFVAVQAIALLATLTFGLSWLFIGIGLFFIGEYCMYCSYERSVSREDYAKRRALSRSMLLVHTAWCICTILLAVFLGVIDGFNILVENQVGNSYEYKTSHQDPYWWVLLIMLAVRTVEQLFIEKALNENIKLAEK